MKIVYILANSADPDEIPESGSSLFVKVHIVPFRPFAPGKKAVFNVRIMLAELRSKESDRYKKIRGFA